MLHPFLFSHIHAPRPNPAAQLGPDVTGSSCPSGACKDRALSTSGPAVSPQGWSIPHRPDSGGQRFGVCGSCPSAPPPSHGGSHWDGVEQWDHTEEQECFPEVAAQISAADRAGG